MPADSDGPGVPDVPADSDWGNVADVTSPEDDPTTGERAAGAEARGRVARGEGREQLLQQRLGGSLQLAHARRDVVELPPLPLGRGAQLGPYAGR